MPGRLPPPEPGSSRVTFFKVIGERDAQRRVTEQLVRKYRDIDLDAAGWTEREREQGFRSSSTLSWGGRIAHAPECVCKVCLRRAAEKAARKAAAEIKEEQRQQHLQEVRAELAKKAVAAALRSARDQAKRDTAEKLGMAGSSIADEAVAAAAAAATARADGVNGPEEQAWRALMKEWVCPGCYHEQRDVFRFDADPEKHRKKCPRFKHWKRTAKTSYAEFRAHYDEVEARKHKQQQAVDLSTRKLSTEQLVAVAAARQQSACAERIQHWFRQILAFGNAERSRAKRELEALDPPMEAQMLVCGANEAGEAGVMGQIFTDIVLPVPHPKLDNRPLRSFALATLPRLRPRATLCDVKTVAIGARHTLLLSQDGEIYVLGSNASGQLGLPFEQHLHFTSRAQREAVASAGGCKGTVDLAENERTLMLQRQYAGQVEHLSATMTQVTWASVASFIKFQEADLGTDLAELPFPQHVEDFRTEAEEKRLAEIELEESSLHLAPESKDGLPTRFPVGFDVEKLHDLPTEQLADELVARDLALPTAITKSKKLKPAEAEKVRKRMAEALIIVVKRELDKLRREAEMRRQEVTNMRLKAQERFRKAKQRAEDRMAARVAALRPQRVTSIAAGEHLSMCVTDRGEVFATGDNSHGQLGLGFVSSLVPRWTLVHSLRPSLIEDAFDFANSRHTQDTKTSKPIVDESTRHDSRVLQLVCGSTHCFAVTNRGQLFACGNASDGRLGFDDGHLLEDRTTFSMVPHFDGSSPGDRRVRKVAVGLTHSIAIDTNGVVWGCGNNRNGELGTHDRLPRVRWTEAEFNLGDLDIGPLPEELSVVDVSCGAHHTIALLQRSAEWSIHRAGRRLDVIQEIWGTGSNQKGQLGSCAAGGSPASDFLVFERLSVPKSTGHEHESVVSVAAGPYHTMVVNTNAAVIATGFNDQGQLGLEDVDQCNEFSVAGYLPHLQQTAIDCVFAGAEERKAAADAIAAVASTITHSLADPKMKGGRYKPSFLTQQPRPAYSKEQFEERMRRVSPLEEKQSISFIASMWCLVGSSFANRSVLWKHSPLSSKKKQGSRNENVNADASASSAAKTSASSSEGDEIEGFAEDGGEKVTDAPVDIKNDVEQLPAPIAVLVGSAAVSAATPREDM